MPLRTAKAVWEGDLLHGKGTMSFGSDSFEGQYSFSSRFEEGKGTNPEELIGAAHSGCFSMAFAHELAQAGFSPERVATQATVNLKKNPDGFKIQEIELFTEASVPGIDEDKFLEIAEGAKKNCPVSQALAGVEIHLRAVLVNK